mgnify:CR=1 FL=1
MEQNLLTKKKLKEKSIEYQIPFANLLEGFLQETLMFQILETDFAKRLWLKNREAFDLDSYRKEWQKPLHFVYGQDDGKEQQVFGRKSGSLILQRRSARNGNIISAGIILWKKRNRTIWFT